MITVTNLAKSFGGDTVWSGVSAEFPHGQLTALVGPSGCGKSTLLNCLGGIDVPDSGQVSVDGVALSRLRARGRRKFRWNHVGYLFQDFALIDNESVADNLRVAMPAFRSRAARNRDIAAVLRDVGLESRENSVVHALSGGQQQRVALARLLLRDPSAILADEPTAALDRHNASRVLELVRLRARAGATAVIATHDPWVVDHCDTVLDVSTFCTTPPEERH
ncbi:ABC transporter ATP-binding protein [Corynebacterium sp. c6VSa_13]|uniref:ABC transporter ATP-binding protein n=1 Tax=Corynebacterium sp. c6VSa_13 TaxID=2913496 RepID=UPI0022BA6554|nr:ABC transporter ATP-binding protein [Corynebacterium sp. c6VSa_13]MCZ9308185.1 ABC transporter ATP-binding protein [Corynebacterium sp. c6VSa_13]